MSEPVRTCVACRTRRPQRALLRLRRRPDGVVVPAVGRRTHGRSAYVCASAGCLSRAVQRRAIERSLSRRNAHNGGSATVRTPSSEDLQHQLLTALDHEITNMQRSGDQSRGPRYDALHQLRRGLREPGRSA